VGGQYQEFKMDAVKLDEYENKWLERLEQYEKEKAARQAKQDEKFELMKKAYTKSKATS